MTAAILLIVGSMLISLGVTYGLYMFARVEILRLRLWLIALDLTERARADGRSNDVEVKRVANAIFAMASCAHVWSLRLIDRLADSKSKGSAIHLSTDYPPANEAMGRACERVANYVLYNLPTGWIELVRLRFNRAAVRNDMRQTRKSVRRGAANMITGGKGYSARGGTLAPHTCPSPL